MTALAFVAWATVMGAAPLPIWNFVADSQGWVANAHLTNVEVKDGRLCGDLIDWDPFFTKTGLAVEATPWQCVIITMKADKPGMGELFWSGGNRRAVWRVFGGEKDAVRNCRQRPDCATFTCFRFGSPRR